MFISDKDQAILKDLSKYIWWQDSDYAIKNNTLRLIASAMCLANNFDDFLKLESLDKELLKETLKQAQPGWFDARNWHFWHYRLYDIDVKVPALKKRGCLDAGNSDNTLIYMTSNNVKLSFFGGIKFVDISKKIKTDDEILMLADLISLLVTKLKATCDRSEYKDYIDIYTILKQGNETQTLSNALIDFPKFFGKDFPSVNLLKNLTYFEDGDLNRLSKKEKNFFLEVTKSIDISKIINNDKER